MVRVEAAISRLKDAFWRKTIFVPAESWRNIQDDLAEANMYREFLNGQAPNFAQAVAFNPEAAGSYLGVVDSAAKPVLAIRSGLVTLGLNSFVDIVTDLNDGSTRLEPAENFSYIIKEVNRGVEFLIRRRQRGN